jgi:DNA-binding transcriptional LysR family regulator
MDIAQIRAFVVLAELKHFGRAADRLHITQPALTKRLHSLEATIGASLFQRDRTGTVLTPVGRSLLGDATRLISDADAFHVRARRVAQGAQGKLDVGFGLSTIDMAPRMVGQFQRAFPDVAVSLDDFSSSEQADRLLDGRLDVGFVRLPVGSSRLTSRVLATDRLALAYSPLFFDLDGAAVPQGIVDAGFVFLHPHRGPGLASQINRWCKAVGFEPRIIQVASDIQTVLALVAAGVGLSIVPLQATQLMKVGLELRALEGPDAEWETGISWRQDHDNPALSNFLKMLESGPQ